MLTSQPPNYTKIIVIIWIVGGLIYLAYTLGKGNRHDDTDYNTSDTAICEYEPDACDYAKKNPMPR